MSHSRSKYGIRTAVLVLSVLGLSCASSSQDRPCPPEKEAFTIVHDLLSVAYPEVFGKERYVRLATGHPLDSSWAEVHGVEFSVLRFGPGVSFDPRISAITGKGIPAPENTIFLSGSFWFDDKTRVIQVEIEGDDARSVQNETVRKLIESHPEWTDAAMIQALKQGGAKYGPGDKDDFLKHIQLERLEKILGHIRTKSVEFYDFANPEHVGNFAELFWSVKIQAEQLDGTERKYSLSFEPFEGKLIGITRLRD